jgi:hypothetical protein
MHKILLAVGRNISKQMSCPVTPKLRALYMILVIIMTNLDASLINQPAAHVIDINCNFAVLLIAGRREQVFQL